MDLSVSDITLKIMSHKKLITTAQVNNFVVTFVVKLCGVNTKNHFKINNCLWMKMRSILTKNWINYKITFTKLHDAVWENVVHFWWCCYAWSWMGCVSVYTINYQYLENSQLLPRPYLGSLEGNNWETIKKNFVRLGSWSWFFFLGLHWSSDRK